MPGRTSPPVPPRLVISEPTDEETYSSLSSKLATTRRRAGPSPTAEEQGKSASEWIDIEEKPKRRRRRSRQSTTGSERAKKFKASKLELAPESDLGRFFPKLSRILETTETNVGSRSGTRVSDASRRSDRNPRASRHRDETSSIHHRSPRYRSSGVQRRTDSLFKVNPSLLSVLSGLTSTSDRSSGSNSTITQRSYNRRHSVSNKTTTANPRRPPTYSESIASDMSRLRSPNVFDYMQTPSMYDGHDGHDNLDNHSMISSTSSTSSHYQPSDAGSSEAPTTPSSRSTFPSPTTRRGSVAELRRKYDPSYAASSTSRDSIGSVDSLAHSYRKQPSVSDVLEDDDEDQRAVSSPTAASELEYGGYKRPPRNSSRSGGAEHRLRQQEESMRQHITFTQPSYQSPYGDQQHDPCRTPSLSSSVHSEPSVAHKERQALQHYQHNFQPAGPSPPHAPLPPALAYSPPTRPPAPDAPDLHKKTLAGYEQLATHLASPSADVKPLYRKFTYLHHRILLHLQDELAEMEAQLRTLDEIIAQAHLSSAPSSPDRRPPPASRRAENWHGGDIFVQRTGLLGRVFLKQEQYQRALRGYAEASREGRPAEEDEVQRYAAWMSEHRPVHPLEAEYLRHREDLLVPGEREAPPLVQKAPESLKMYWPVALVAPVLMFALIPDLAGRLVITALLAAGTALVAGLTEVGGLLNGREWAICGGVYVLVMAGVAGVVPSRA